MSSSHAAMAPLAMFSPEKHTSAIAMNEARRRRGVISDRNAKLIGSIAEKKIPEIPRSQAIIVVEVDHAAQNDSTPNTTRHSASTGLRPTRSASGGMAK